MPKLLVLAGNALSSLTGSCALGRPLVWLPCLAHRFRTVCSSSRHISAVTSMSLYSGGPGWQDTQSALPALADMAHRRIPRPPEYKYKDIDVNAESLSPGLCTVAHSNVQSLI